MLSEQRKHSDEESTDLFKHLWGVGDELLQILAPDGWTESPLIFVFHPTPQQQYEHALRFHERMKHLPSGTEMAEENHPPRLEEFLNEKDKRAPVQPKKEVIEIYGRCLWDIFSDNHTIRSNDGNEYDIGSFRAAAGFIADFINQQFSDFHEGYDYLNFYMGTSLLGYTDFIPIYEMIFKRLKGENCDWEYSFPRIYAISPFEIKEAWSSEESENPADYDPNKALQEEAERTQKKKELEEFRTKLDEDYRDAIERAKHAPLPPTVHAYKNVYGHLPAGWPQP